ncbi:MAG: PaaI family thioesterase [Gammaproteobacteria bacterium]|nr:PaaI family thioesterase [Gammaproteobacteria bacterium]
MHWTIDALNDNPLYVTLGIRLLSMLEDEAVSELRPTPQVCWPQRGQPHGGVLFTQLDTTMASAVLAGLPSAAGCSTINADVQYLAPARGPLLRCTARVQRRGGKVCFVRAETEDAEGNLVALAQGSFRIFASGKT